MSKGPRSSPRLSHTDRTGIARMVDVGEKPVTQRIAIAEAFVRISPALARAIRANTLKKGNLLDVARIAGIGAAKRTAELIPLCHPLPLDFADVRVRLERGRVHIVTEMRVEARTGVEMEALTAAAVAALTVIDMGKSVDKGMVVEGLRVLEKRGGRSGDYSAGGAPRRRPANRAGSPTALRSRTAASRVAGSGL